jgi:serine/threonine-protein kinase
VDDVTSLAAALSDRYLIEREIGRGGMATVYLARDKRHDRPVAVKVLNAELGAVLGVERFLAEIRVTANLQHPNLLPLFDSGEADGMLFYVMPYVEGESLRHRLEREKQLPVEEAARIGVAVSSALDYAHRHGVIHRDLKPENILLHDGQPLLADFGIALAVSNAGGSRITQTGLSLGTPSYMSPEQATGDRVIDARTDIYSIGAVVYEMLTGEPPHIGNTAQAIIARVLTEPARPARLSRPAVPEHVDYAVSRALEKLPADRWATAGQFCDALQGKSTVNLSAAARIAPSTASRRRRAFSLAAAAIVGVAVGAASVLATRRAPVEEARYPVRFDLPVAASAEAATSFMAISPDGRLVVYGARDPQSGQSQLHLHRLDAGTSRPLPGTEGAVGLCFSPDSRSIAFNANARVYRLDLEGGTPIALGENVGSQGIAWPTRETIVIARNRRLHRLPASSAGASVELPLPKGVSDADLRGPRALADGNTILHAVAIPGENFRVGILSLAEGRDTITDIPGIPVGMIDGQLLVASNGVLSAIPFDLRARRVLGDPVALVDSVSTSAGGHPRAYVSTSGSLLYRVGTAGSRLVLSDSTGKELSVVAENASLILFPRFSPDGNRVAYNINTATVWVHDLRSNTPTRVATEGGRNERPEWTPDGRSLLFISDRDGSTAAWMQNVDLSGSPAKVIAVAEGMVDEVIATPDGAALLARATGARFTQDFFLKQLSGDTTLKPLFKTPSVEYAPRLTRDGKWMAYTDNRGGTPEIFVQPFPLTGARHQLTATGGSPPVWSKDGRRLYYLSGGAMNIVDVSTAGGFSVRGRQKLFDAAGIAMPIHANFDVSPDGLRFLIVKSAVGADSRTVVVHDWKYELKRRIATRR